ncbi:MULTISPECIES: endo-1,4-beta-xylanase [Salegentibacter]|uniref:endo-1,4-beta-xylanase n=1 Tax=Salegentibacter agarivorans TaxID=345907 RepID=A0A1I2KVP7_9FLAO|nr:MULTISPECIES: endo-1,4-beta-xylanase [Salegentibacter]SFF70330.1 Carbohydrate binding domain-containing protein [Salegentibacter agarivorans]
MKYLNRFLVCSGLLASLFSCADPDPLAFEIEKPEGLEAQEDINSYAPLKSYKDSTSNFTLGGTVSISDYINKGVMYRLINKNFDELTVGYGMKHGAIVQNDGSMNFAQVNELIAAAQQAGTSIYGHTLTWHANQNAEYLNSTIAPTVIGGGPSWDEIAGADFETDEAANYEANEDDSMSFTADGEGADGEGRALAVTNGEVRENDWESQFFFKFSPPMEVGEEYELTMDVRSDADASFATQAHIQPGEYKHWDFFGAIPASAEWTTFTKRIIVSEEMAGSSTIAFNLGNVATTYYFDNISLKKYNEEGSGGGPALDPSVISNSDFETGTDGWAGWGNGSTMERSSEGEGYGDTGYAFTFTNPSATNFWEAQIAYDLPTLEMEETYVLNFKVKANTAGTLRAELQSPSDYSSDGLGSFNVSEDWEEYTLETTITKEDRERLVISYGDFAGTVYIDDVTLSRVNPNAGGVIEKTPEEKEEIIGGEMERWITSMMEVSKDYVDAWDVVNEPMDDGNPYELKSGATDSDITSDEFYWQDYLGKDYAVKAFKLAREYGSPEDLLFINDYNLEYNLDKTRGLIEYVEYIESQGATVDGIGTQMHISIDSDKNNIAQMFQLLAETGKLIKVSELDVRTNVSEPTDEVLQQQAEMYSYVVEAYKEHVPQAQRYGITVWGVTDSPEDANWLPGEFQGLWDVNLNRKPAYKSFAEALEEL